MGLNDNGALCYLCLDCSNPACPSSKIVQILSPPRTQLIIQAPVTSITHTRLHSTWALHSQQWHIVLLEPADPKIYDDARCVCVCVEVEVEVDAKVDIAVEPEVEVEVVFDKSVDVEIDVEVDVNVAVDVEVNGALEYQQ